MARPTDDASSWRSCETPQREVTIGYQLAAGKFEVTFDEWDFCLADGEACRMLTEAEWEYAASAGTSTKYAFGDIITTAQANFYGERAPKVGSFAPNGLVSTTCMAACLAHTMVVR